MRWKVERYDHAGQTVLFEGKEKKAKEFFARIEDDVESGDKVGCYSLIRVEPTCGIIIMTCSDKTRRHKGGMACQRRRRPGSR